MLQSPELKGQEGNGTAMWTAVNLKRSDRGRRAQQKEWMPWKPENLSERVPLNKWEMGPREFLVGTSTGNVQCEYQGNIECSEWCLDNPAHTSFSRWIELRFFQVYKGLA